MIQGPQSVIRALALLEPMLGGAGKPIADLAHDLNMPVATAYRLAHALVDAGYVVLAGRGIYLPGPALARLAPLANLRPALVAVARPVLAQLARRFDCVAHLGVYESDMVTYLVKAGRSQRGVFTAEGKQLEAYCSGIGRVLLASMSDDMLDTYLAAGPFVALTPQTVIDPAALHAAIIAVRQQGFARDAGEVAIGLNCVAVGIADEREEVIAAISLSQARPVTDEAERVAALATASQAIGARLFRRG